MDSLSKKTAHAMKWSSITEICAKITTPLINMLLARVLAPEAFGMLATVTMVISFAEVFVEAGFQKFLIQYKFSSEEREQQCTSVAFWANLIFSGIIWGAVIAARSPLAAWAGNPGMGDPIGIAGVAIPLYGVIGIQNSKLRKKLDFKGLFFVRLVSSLVPLVVTLPLALLGFGFWALIIGQIASAVVRSAVLSFVGGFKPSWYFSFADLKFMLKSGMWTLLDGIAIWATNWIDALLIATHMSDYYLGLYKNTSATIVSIFAIITSALTPVLFSSLAKLQDDEKAFNAMFLKVQKILSVFLLPLCAGVFFYRDVAVDILFGSSWKEAADIVGVMAVTTALRTIFISFYGDAYRAKGKFYLPLILQIVEVVVLVPTCMIAVRYGFWPLVYARALIKLDLVIPEIFVVWKVCGITPLQTFRAVYRPAVATACMILGVLLLQSVSESFLWAVISIVISVAIYFSALFLFKEERQNFLMPLLNKIHKSIKR